jgi:flagellin
MLRVLQASRTNESRLNETQNIISTGQKVRGAEDDASSFSIAQGIRGDNKAWGAVAETLSHGEGVTRVAIAGATAISELLTDMRKKVIEYFSTTDPQLQTIYGNDLDELSDQIDRAANASTFFGANLITRDQASVQTGTTQPPGFLSAVNSGGAGVTTNNHVVGATPGTVILDYDMYGMPDQLDIIYNGVVVATTGGAVSGQGQLTFAFGGAPTDFDVQVTGPNGTGWTYDLTFSTNGGPPLTTAPGEFLITRNPVGDSIDVQYRSLLAADIGVDNLRLISLADATAQIDTAVAEVNSALSYYGRKTNEIQEARRNADLQLDGQSVGLGAIVDADMGRASSRLLNDRLRYENSIRQVTGATRSPLNVLRALFYDQRT